MFERHRFLPHNELSYHANAQYYRENPGQRSEQFELRWFGKMSKPLVIHRSRFGLTAVAVLYLGGLHGFAATTNRWISSGDGLWSTGSNWSSNRPPGSTFAYILITNANSKAVTIDATTPLTNLTIQRLTISAPSGSTNTLALANVGTNL